jgi:predicted  nucleic acid-binding Zn-ribbon protein
MTKSKLSAIKQTVENHANGVQNILDYLNDLQETLRPANDSLEASQNAIANFSKKYSDFIDDSDKTEPAYAADVHLYF